MNRSSRPKPYPRSRAARRAVLAAGACAALAASTMPGGSRSGSHAERRASRTGRRPTRRPCGPAWCWRPRAPSARRNFVFNDAAGHVYLGQAAHCSSQGEPTDFNGCKDKSYPLGTKVDVVGSQVSGALAYSSWLTMQGVTEKNKFACAENDLALVQIPDDVRDVVNPSLPYYGGPTGVNKTGVAVGESVYSYGNSPLRLERRPALARRAAPCSSSCRGAGLT